MNTSLSAFSFKKQANAVEWKLLVFLVLFMDVKLLVKLAAIVMIYVLQPDFRFGFKLKNSRLPLFYLLVIGIAIINWLIYRNYSLNYTVVVLTGILFWAACILAIHQVKLFVEQTDISILHNTLLVFFVLNIAASLFNLSTILMEIGLRNPFLYQGDYQKYFINTGDHIKGISFDSSTTNAVINSFGIVYFLYRQKYLLVIACMIILILTASNFTNAILLFVFAALFIFKSTREQKSTMAICVFLLVIFLAKFSPQNDNYINYTFEKYVLGKKDKITAPEKIIPIRERPDSLLDEAGKKEKTAILFLDSLERVSLKKQGSVVNAMGNANLGLIKERPQIPGDSIHTAKFQWKRDTTANQRQILSYVEKNNVEPVAINSKYDNGTPGKILAIKESVVFFKQHPARIITGDGTGNFSSKLAFRATGLKIAGGYPKSLVYNNKDFLDNHFSLYTYFFTKNAASHSLVHSPASAYDQLITEYGIAGITAFLFYYAGFFLKHIKKLSYGIPLLGMMLAVFMVDYWFEQLSIVLLFELMMFVNIKEHTKPVYE
jgi:hypothetical protein